MNPNEKQPKCPYCGDSEHVHYSRKHKSWGCSACHDWFDSKHEISD